MTLVELITEVAREAKVPRTKVSRVLRAALKKIDATVMSGEDVRLLRFGVFSPAQLEERSVFGGKRAVKARRTIRFRPARRERWRSSE